MATNYICYILSHIRLGKYIGEQIWEFRINFPIQL